MNTTTAAVATGVVVTAGRWADGKNLDVRIAIGTGALAIGLAVLSGANEQLASRFAVLVLLGAVLVYPTPARSNGIIIAQKLGA